MRLLADENFNQKIVRGLMRRNSDLNITSVHDVGLRGATDADVLAWAAEDGRIVLTHDQSTMPNYAYERVTSGAFMPGVFVIGNRLAIGTAIDELLLMAECTEQSEWTSLVVHVPI